MLKRNALWALVLAPIMLAAAEPDAALQNAIQDALYRIEPVADGYTARNPAQRISAHFADGRAVFRLEQHRFSLSLAGAEPALRTRTAGNRIDFEHAGVVEWYVNEPSGIEQGFTVSHRAASGPLELTLQVGGDLEPRLEEPGIVLRAGGRSILRYGGLFSRDADGRELPSRLAVEGRTIRVQVDDSQARYPIVIDPVVQQGQFPTPVGANGFGGSLALSGGLAVVGATGANSFTGAAYVFALSNGAWTQVATLTSPDGISGDLFGISVAISGGMAVVGDCSKNSSTGAAYVYTQSSNWSLQAILLASDGQQSDCFGGSLATNGSNILVGAYGNHGHTGAVYVFTPSGNSWGQAAKLTASDPAQTNAFGFSLAINGSIAAVGSYGAKGTGAVYVLSGSGSSWTQVAELTPSDGADADFFGYSVAINHSKTIVAGAPNHNANDGAAYVFTQSGNAWSQQAEFVPTDTNQFGTRVAISDDMITDGTVVVGAPGANVPGKVFVFTPMGSAWNQVEFQAPTPFNSDNFGLALAISGSTVIVGDDFIATTYIFQLTNVSVLSNPSGRSFSLNGPGCGTAGTFTTPYTGYWTSCSVGWPPVDTSVPGTEYRLTNWFDGNIQTQRTLSGGDISEPAVYSADFQTRYQLTTQSSPSIAGSVVGGAFYVAGDTATVIAVPSPGFLFTNFSGGSLTGLTNPQTLTMTAPKTVVANFTQTPPAVLTAAVMNKAGAATDRVWTISVTNTGPGPAYNTEVAGAMLIQTFGTACVPVGISPAVFPIALGNIGMGQSVQTAVAWNFSSCPANARFTASLAYVSNGGWSAGSVQLANQFQ